MLDVHPPHHAANTWRDFFIHIATIVVGLLIAVGLEQSVEWMHHRHQRHEVQEELRAEAEQNIATIETDNRLDLPDFRYTEAVLARLRNAKAEAGSISIILPPIDDDPGNYHAPSRAVWSTAKADGTAGLLGPEEEQLYSRLDFVAERASDANQKSDEAANQLTALEWRLDIQLNPGKTLRLNSADRDELLRQLSFVESAKEWQMLRYAVWADSSEAILRNIRTVEAVASYTPRRQALVRQLSADHP